MSINHYSPNPSSSNHRTFFPPHILIPTSPASYWPSHRSAAMFGAALSFNLNNEDEESSVEDQATAIANDREAITTTQFEQEKLFEKPLTPSDVGKLNRLVIPKQHAEKHFPLNGGDSAENGLLLGFEDETGKPWRFRYSYWNSSQSYVLTKGWSRFVKEKRLDAGDIVLFGRHRNDFGRLFIGWRRRNSGQEGGGAQPHLGWNGVVYPAGYAYQRSSQHEGSSSVVYQTDCANAEKERGGGSGNSKRLRLFGVNLEWAEGEAAEAAGRPYSSDHHQRTWI